MTTARLRIASSTTLTRGKPAVPIIIVAVLVNCRGVLCLRSTAIASLPVTRFRRWNGNSRV